ncbi:MAG: tRNA (guanosine(37)-N1)-methyltransferase TrmD [Clostridiales bacterium]|mgnify:CR=1 FL=1|nr:tRNA (guanosine(37)-N1)-methyltransferase TrmD [Clostridiales bacterium]
MNFHVLTLFPEMILQGGQTSILGRAIKNGYITLNAVDIRDYTESKHKKVDDYPYGGGAGMLMQAQPVYDAYQAVSKKLESGKARVIYLTPQGRTFEQKMAEELSKEKDIVFLCGHYEGIDERVLEEIVTDYVSVGDYVLTGGELPAMVMIDAISRLVPGVLNNDTSADFETFHNDLLEYPQYSRPEEWKGKSVPQVLLSGNHTKIAEWRLEQSIRRTKERRPDLYDKYKKKQQVIEKLLKKDKFLYIDMIESLRRGRGELIYNKEGGVVVKDGDAGIYMLAAFDSVTAEEIADTILYENETGQFLVHQECLLKSMEKRFRIEEAFPIKHAVYTQRVPLSVSKEITFTPLGIDYLEEVMEHYHIVPDEAYIKERLLSGNIIGAFIEDRLAGFVGIHKEGSLGILEVYEAYRRKGVAASLEAYMINRQLSCGYIPYGDVLTSNEASLHLQEKLGLCISKEILFWVELNGYLC